MKSKILLIFFVSLLVTMHSFGQNQAKSKTVKADQKNSEEARMAASTLIHKGDMAPDFTVHMLDGTQYTLSDLKGKVVLVNFWATWCPPCMKEFGEIPEHIIKPFAANKDFVFIPISRAETEKVVREKMKFLKTRGIDFNVGLDPDRKIYARYAKEFIPRNFLVDQNGRVVLLSIGYTPESMNELVAKIKSLLQKK